MRKLSFICLWTYIIFLLLGVLVGTTATILQFVSGEVAAGFSDLLWTCICVWVLSATVGIKASDKVRERNG